MSIDNNTLNFLNLKEAQVEDISTTCFLTIVLLKLVGVISKAIF